MISGILGSKPAPRGRNSEIRLHISDRRGNNAT